MSKVVSQVPALTEAVMPSPSEIYNIGLQTAKEVDDLYGAKGVRSNRVGEWKRKYGKKFGGC